MELMIPYLLVIVALALRSFRLEQTQGFEAIGDSPDSLSSVNPPRMSVRAVLAPAIAFALIAPCSAGCVGLFFRDDVPRKFCPPQPNCWSTGPDACTVDCLAVEGVAAALPVDENEVVALREFTLRDDTTGTRRVWAFERFTRSGHLIIRSFMFEGTNRHSVMLESTAREREFEVLLKTEEGKHGFDVRVSRASNPDWPTSHTFESRLPEWRSSAQPEPVTVRIPLWRGSPRQLNVVEHPRSQLWF